MIGNRGCADGDEYDAFSRRARHMLSWRPGELKRIKRAFTKRTLKWTAHVMLMACDNSHWQRKWGV